MRSLPSFPPPFSLESSISIPDWHSEPGTNCGTHLVIHLTTLSVLVIPPPPPPPGAPSQPPFSNLRHCPSPNLTPSPSFAFALTPSELRTSVVLFKSSLLFEFEVFVGVNLAGHPQQTEAWGSFDHQSVVWTCIGGFPEGFLRCHSQSKAFSMLGTSHRRCYSCRNVLAGKLRPRPDALRFANILCTS